MEKISFIHCSDLHLGCQQFNEPERWDDFGKSFAHIVDYAIEHRVDFMLIGGDLFHHRSINAATLEQAIGLLSRLRLAGIDVYAIEGNHDKAFYTEGNSWMNFLNGQGYIRLLKPFFEEGRVQLTPYDGKQGCIIEKGGIRIIGLGYLGATTRQRLEETAAQIEDYDGFNILLLHAAVDKLLGQDMAGVGREIFDAFGERIDYFALGHAHSRQEVDERIFNPGAPECVHIDEARNDKEKGFYHVTVEGRDKQVQFIPSIRRPVCYLDVDLSGLETPSGIMPRVIEVMEPYAAQGMRRPMVQVNLYGNIAFNSLSIDLNMISEEMKESYDCLAVEVVNNTNLPGAAIKDGMLDFDRTAIERHVITQMVEEENPEWKRMGEQMVDLILQFKNQALFGADEKDLVAVLNQAMDSLLIEEAAFGREEGKKDED